MSADLLQPPYWPDELPSEDAAQTRQVLADYLEKHHPELDTSPLTPFGDLHTTPLARLLTAAQEAVRRYSLDLDLDNIAAGGAYNCAVAAAFVRQFGRSSAEALKSQGYVTMLLTAPDEVELPAGLRFRFNVFDNATGESQESIFRIRTGIPGSTFLTPVGSAWETDRNAIPLTRIGESLYSAMVPVEGDTLTTVPAGTAAEVNRTITGLTSATARYAILPNNPAEGLKDQAKRTRDSFYGASFLHRRGARRHLQDMFPLLTSVQAVLPGDTEFLRASNGPLGLLRPASDLFIKSRQYGELQTEQVRLWWSGDDDVPGEKFYGVWTPQLPAVTLEDIRWTGDPLIQIDDAGGSVKLVSVSQNATKAPLLTAGGSALETLHFLVDMPKDLANTPLIDMDVDADGRRYAWFTVTYRSEPAVRAVQNFLDGEAPPHISCLAKPAQPVSIKSMTVRYRRKAGTRFLETSARGKIEAYVNSIPLGGLFHEARVGDIVLQSGASDYLGITCQAQLFFSPARYVTDVARDTATQSTETWEATLLAAPSVTAATGSALHSLDFVDPEIGTAEETLASSGPRGKSWLLPEGIVIFDEVPTL